MNDVRLRDYQQKTITALERAYAQKRRRVIVNLFCGLGKTITAMSLVARAVAKGSRVVWLARREELLSQARQAALALGIQEAQVGLVKADSDEVTASLVLASAQTLWRTERLARILSAGQPRLVVYDECDDACATCNRTMLDALSPDTFVIGLTATPERTDGASLAGPFPGGICYSYSLLEAIRDGWLVDFKAIQVDVPEIQLDALALGGDGDFEDGALADALVEDGVIRATARAWLDHCRGRRTLVFTASVLQAERTAIEMRALGARVEAVSGQTPTDARRAAVAALRRGGLDAVANCALFTHGTDLPEVDTILMARPTLSKPLYQQIAGRALRLSPNKDGALIVDLCGSSLLHSPCTAPILVGAARGTGGWLGAAALASRDGGDLKSRTWDVRAQKKTWAAWVALGNGDVMAASGPERSMVIVKPVGSGGWGLRLLARVCP